MTIRRISFILLLLLATSSFHFSFSQTDRWEIIDKSSIRWSVKGSSLSHGDNIEMAGRRVAGIIHYGLDTARTLWIERQVFFPQLRTHISSADPDWFIYRAYLKDAYSDAILPKLYIGERQFVAGPVDEVTINGQLHFTHAPSKSGIALQRSFLPSMSERVFMERWTLSNTTAEVKEIDIANTYQEQRDRGPEGSYLRTIHSDAKSYVSLAPGESYSFGIYISARLGEEPKPVTDQALILKERADFLTSMQQGLQLETPDPVLNTLFEFSKVRASESIFESRLGLIHSPGGGRYYIGTWANDQAEYVGPFAPYLDYETGVTAAMNTYRAFAGETNPEYKALRYAFEMAGAVPPFLLDRGDAAMIAYGGIQFALASGEEAIARELWPLLTWCLEYCHRQLNEAGVVRSESDEMEGRIETGTANLSTSSLYYGALQLVDGLGRDLGIAGSELKRYRQQAKALGTAIEAYFGASVEGLETYRYYDGHEKLRHWICLPLVVGINQRKEATTTALFDRLWTTNGVHVEKNADNPKISEIFWDRGTLYALRGTFLAGATEVSLEKLQAFSRTRLLGGRVPYVVEAYPEGNMAHLSAESGLYCRVFTEGLFGIIPTGLKSFQFTPQLPKDWDEMALRQIRAFGGNFDIEVQRKGKQLQVIVKDLTHNKTLYDQVIPLGKSILIKG